MPEDETEPENEVSGIERFMAHFGERVGSNDPTRYRRDF